MPETCRFSLFSTRSVWQDGSVVLMHIKPLNFWCIANTQWYFCWPYCDKIFHDKTTAAQQSSPRTRWEEILCCRRSETREWNDRTIGAAATATVSWRRSTWHTVLRQKSDQEAATDLDPIYNIFNKTRSAIRTIQETLNPYVLHSHNSAFTGIVYKLVFYGTFSTNRLYHAIEVGNVSHRAGREHKYNAIKQQKNTINQS